MAAIINSVIAGSSGGGDIVTAKINTQDTPIGTKVILNEGYAADTAISGMPYVSSATNNNLLCIYSNYLYFYPYNNFNSYWINDNENRVLNFGAVTLPASYIPAGNSVIIQSTNEYTGIATNNKLIKYYGSSQRTYYYTSDISIALKNYFTVNRSKIGRVAPEAKIFIADSTFQTYLPTEYGCLCKDSQYLVTLDDEENLISSPVSITGSDFISNLFEIQTGLYVKLTDSSANCVNIYFYKLNKTGETSYNFTQQYLPASVSQYFTGTLLRIGNLSGNRFYFVTSTTTDNKNYLYIVDYDGENLSTATIEKVITTEDLGIPVYANNASFILSYDEKYIAFAAPGKQSYLFRQTAQDGWEAVEYNGLNFVSSSLTGFTTTEPELNSSGEYSVKVSTVLPPT